MFVSGKMTRREAMTNLAAAGSCAAAPPTRALAQAGARREPVTIVTTQGTAGLTLQEILKREGYLESFGLDATILNVSDAAKVMAAMFGGTADICMWSGFGQVPVAIERGAKLRILGGALMFPTHAVFTSRPHIQSVKDLEGKIIGVGALGAQLHQVMLALFRKKGVDAGKVTFRNVGSNSDVFRAIVAGTVDAGPSEIDVLENQTKYRVRSLSDGELWTEVPEFTFQAAYAPISAIEKKRDILVRVLAAYAKLYRFVSSAVSRETFLKAHALVTGKADPVEAEGQWRFIQKYRPYAVDLVLSEERIRFMQELNNDLGLQKQVLPFAQVADMSLANDALALLARDADGAGKR